MAGIKNQEIAAILQEWLELGQISNAEAARTLHVSAPVLWRQLEAKDSIPLSRIEEFVKLWAPSDDEITRLESLMNEILAPEPRRVEKDYGRYIGKLDIIADMLRNAVMPVVPENMKSTVTTMADSLNDIALDMSGKKKREKPQVQYYNFPRKSAKEWEEIRLLKDIDYTCSQINGIHINSIDEDPSRRDKNQKKLKELYNKFEELKQKAYDLNPSLKIESPIGYDK